MTGQPPRAIVVVPTYAEAACIGALLTRLRAVADVDVLVVDDDSPDETREIVHERAAAVGGIHLLHRRGHRGYASACIDGFVWALQRGYDAIAQMDADLSHCPETVPHLLAGLDHADLVIGSRYVSGGSTTGWPWHRRALSRWANRYARLVLRLKPADVTSGFRAYRADHLCRLRLDEAKAEGYAFLVEMLMVAELAGARVEEVAIEFSDRSHGKSKMSGRIVLEAIFLITKWALRRPALARSVAQDATADADAGAMAPEPDNRSH